MLEVYVCGSATDRGTDEEMIERLIRNLNLNLWLDPMFERFGNYIITKDPALPFGVVRFWGNFQYVNFPFCIDTDDKEIINDLTAAIRQNQVHNAKTKAARK